MSGICAKTISVAMMACCWSVALAIPDIDTEYLTETGDSEAADWLPQPLQETYLDEPSSPDEYQLESRDVEPRDVTDKANREMAPLSKRSDHRSGALNYINGKRLAFWKRVAGYNGDVDRFWKRQHGNQNTNAFWKRSPGAAKGWPGSLTDAEKNVAFWKRNRAAQDIQAFLNHGDGQVPGAVYRNALGDGSDSGPTAAKRAGLPWNLMMFPRYRPTEAFVAPRRPNNVQWLVKMLNEKKHADDRQILNLPIPPKNRRKGPKVNPDFNPTGW